MSVTDSKQKETRVVLRTETRKETREESSDERTDSTGQRWPEDTSKAGSREITVQSERKERHEAERLSVEDETKPEAVKVKQTERLEVSPVTPHEKYSSTEITVTQKEVDVKEKSTAVGQTQVKMEGDSDKVSVKKQEEKIKYEEIIQPEKPKAKKEAKVENKESVTDIELRKPQVIKPELVSAKEEEEAVHAEETKEEPENKRRISSDMTSRGTERNSDLTFIFIIFTHSLFVVFEEKPPQSF